MDGPDPTVERLFRDATRLLNEGELGDAENLYREALRRAPESASVRANLALLLQRAGRAPEAERYYRDVLEREPGNAQIHLNFGVLLAARRRFAKPRPGVPAGAGGLPRISCCVVQAGLAAGLPQARA